MVMNALERQVADFLAKSNGGEIVTVDEFSLEPLRNDADYVVAWLSNGKVLSVKWDQQNDAAILLLADSNEVEGVEVSAAETRLAPSLLKKLVDATYNAWRDYMAECADFGGGSQFEERS